MEVATSAKDAAATAASPVVLVVDDNETTARALQRVLHAAHIKAAIVFRGAEAIEYAQHHPLAAAVVDIHLPDLNGLVVTQKLREQLGPDLPIIILSGDTSMGLLNSLPHVGATYFFSKPVNSAHLVQRLHEWVGRPSSDGAQRPDGQG